MKKSLLVFIMLLFLALTTVNAQVFITELADPNGNTNGRYIELYNAGETEINFTEGSNWRIDKYTNAGATSDKTINLTGSIAAGGFYIIATGAVDGDFFTLYSVNADQFDGAGDDVAGSNGDDNLELYDGTGALVDQFGVPGEDGSGTTHEFEDGRAERVATVTAGKALWDVTEWNIDNDGTLFPGDGPQAAPDGFDPGTWIGAGGSVIDHEPTNHVTSFTATANGYNQVDLTWTDNDGAQVADGYLIKSSKVSYAAIVAPVDGTAETTDTDMSDSLGSVNVSHGSGSYSWTGPSGLEGSTAYYYKVYPYTNSGSDIDYKTDGSVPESNVTTDVPPVLPNLVINEFLADPASDITGDANGDGVRDGAQDEFVEIVNREGSSVDISGYTIEDGYGIRHTFAASTILQDGGSVVIFGGGTPTGIPGLVVIANDITAVLGLNNGGDVITFKDDSGNTIDTYTYGSEGGDNQSLARDPDYTGSFVKHSTITTNPVLFSPGKVNLDNSSFPVDDPTPITNDLNLTFEDDSEVTKWSHWNEANLYTTEAYNATAGVDGGGALELGDGGYGMVDKRKVYTTNGTYFTLSVDIKTQGWAVPETYKLFLYAQDFAVLDSVQINSDSGFTTFTLTGTAIADSGYIRVAGNNTAGQNYIWIDNLVFDDDAIMIEVPPYYLAGDFQGWDASSTPLYDDGTNGDLVAEDGIYSLEYSIATTGFHECKATNGTWEVTWPSDNYWFSTTSDAQMVLFTFNTNQVGDGWLPDQYILSTNEVKPTDLVAVGDFQSELGESGDWVNNSTITAMYDDGMNGDFLSGDGIFCYHINTLPTGTYAAKGVKTGEWNGWGTDGRSVNAKNIDFTTTSDNQDVYLYVNVNTGRSFLTFDAITSAPLPNVFFSEYIEGSGNNKALEIFNGGKTELDLSQFVILNGGNGGYWSSSHTFPADAKLASGDVWVMVADQISETLYDTTKADEIISYSSSSPVHYNGDDARAIAMIVGTDTTLIDVFGLVEGVDPGAGWMVGDTLEATSNHTLVRKSTVMSGQTVWALSAGTDNATSEWEIYSENTFKYLGQHPGSGVIELLSEPSEYPTTITAVASGSSILVSWTDSAGDQLPSGYLGLMNTTGTFAPPVDGSIVPDSLGAAYIDFGTESILVTDLDEETVYYFTIYPYTNSGTDIDYKTDGTSPIASDTTGTDPNPILFSNFESDLGDWTGYSVASTNVWEQATGTGANGTAGFAQMNGYNEDVISNDYLIAGPFNLNNFTNEYMEFWSSTKYGDLNSELTLEFSADYDGSSDPTGFLWNSLQFTRPTDNNDTWSHSGKINLEVIPTLVPTMTDNDVVYIAFHYLSNGTKGRWKIDEVGIYGTPKEGVDLPPVVEIVSRNVLVPDADQNTVVSAVVHDDNEVVSVSLIYSNDGLNLNSVAMTASDSAWVGEIPASIYTDGQIFGYFVAATDNIGQSDTSSTSMLYAGNSLIENIKMQQEDGSLEFTGVMARVTGTVSAETGTYSTGRIESYIQDETAGVLVIAFGTETPAMVENNSYTVTGKVIQYNGLVEIEPVTPETDIVDNGAATALEPIILTIDQINASPENFEGMLIRVSSAELSADTPWLGGSSTSGSNMDIFVGGDTLLLRVDADTDIWETSSPTFPQDISGVLGQYDSSIPYNSGYQLLPRSLADFGDPVSVGDENGIPTVYALDQNYPNPFNPSTKINFSLPENGMVTMKIYDILGREVVTLIHQEMVASYHTVQFDASYLTSGIYFYKIQVNDFVSVKKMMLMK